ncbi:MAG: ATP-binding cassette domain-containing protein [Clostridiaceae bacterium]|nr:ATP-binding cassette domain-containing protein [Clostridiaceae bacterium]NBH76635.1 ATP-binding cassette domain-containing protein [Clostridiaceae bacterium]
MPELRLEGVTKYFKVERHKRMAVQDIDLTVRQGEFVFLNGSSGAGKSTILRLLGGDLSPDRGAAYLDNVNMNRYFGPFQYRLRRTFGYVWQDTRLIRKRTIYDNLYLAAQSGGLRKRSAESVEKALSLVGMLGVQENYPAELSIGQVRRVELARALVCSPPILLIDELTANLDDDSIWDLMHLLHELNQRGTTIIMATHASRYVNIMRRRVVTLIDGRLAGDVRNGRYAQTGPRKITFQKGTKRRR